MHKYLLVRHAQPEAGVATQAMPGHVDPVLTRGGRAQAEALARRLAGTHLDTAWSSDLKRAVETAALILAEGHSMPLHLSPLLREIDLPPSPDQPDYSEREAEALARFTAYSSGWLDLVQAELGPAGSGPDRTILVVAHAGMLRVLVCFLLELPAEYHWRFRFDWASLTTIERGDDMGTLTLLNDRGHLDG